MGQPKKPAAINPAPETAGPTVKLFLAEKPDDSDEARWKADGGPIGKLLLAYDARCSEEESKLRVACSSIDQRAAPFGYTVWWDVGAFGPIGKTGVSKMQLPEELKIEIGKQIETLEYERYGMQEMHPLREVDYEADAIHGHDLHVAKAYLAAGQSLRAAMDGLTALGVRQLPSKMQEAIKLLRDGYKEATYWPYKARPPGQKTGGRPVSRVEAINAVIADLVNLASPASPSEIAKILRYRYDVPMSSKDVARAIDNIKKKDAKRPDAERWIRTNSGRASLP